MFELKLDWSNIVSDPGSTVGTECRTKRLCVVEDELIFKGIWENYVQMLDTNQTIRQR